ncbi:MAG TPA: amidase [Streptosporangiales bacterium]
MTATRPADATVAGIRSAYASGELTCREVTERSLARIAAYDQDGPRINAMITVNEDALKDADALDAAFAERGPVGPLHGIPVVVKDQIDAAGMPTTLGSVLFQDYRPDQDATVVARLRSAGALVLGKATLGELGAGDTHGTLFGSTRNPYDLERTVGGSSGGSAAAVAVDYAPLALGLEGFASIRRPAAWNSVVGMRPSLGLVSRTGCSSGWPGESSSVGPLARTVEDAARLLDVLTGYDPLDPSTAYGVDRHPGSFTDGLDAAGLRGVRIGVIRQPIGLGSDPDADDYQVISAAFDGTVAELAAAGAVLVDPVELPGLDALLAARTSPHQAEAFMTWMARSQNPPYRSYDELTRLSTYREVVERRYAGNPIPAHRTTGTHYDHLLAQRKLKTLLLTVMADHGLGAVVHRTVEHLPTLIRDGVNPPYVNLKGAPYINTFLGDVPSISVPSGFTAEGLPMGVTFLGRPFSDAAMLRYAYAYEQATRHRRPPASTPPLP